MKTEINTLLIPVDFSDKSKNALKVAVKMALRHQSKLIITHIVQTYNIIDHAGKQVIGSQTVQDNIDEAQQKLEKMRDRLYKKYNLNVEITISTQNMIDTINDFVDSEKVDLVVMGTNGRQKMKQFILGSNSYNALLHANCSVLLIPENFKKTSFKRILFPVRVQYELLQKADLSILLANKNAGAINLLGVGKPNKLVNVRKAYMEMKKNLLLKSAVYISEFQVSHDHAAIICQAAKEKNSDIILLADQDEDSWKSFMADNFFKKMINKSDIPLFIVKSKLKKLNNKTESNAGYDVTMPIPG